MGGHRRRQRAGDERRRQDVDERRQEHSRHAGEHMDPGNRSVALRRRHCVCRRRSSSGRRLRAACLQDDRLRTDVDGDQGGPPIQRLRPRHPRGSEEPERAVRRHGARNIRFVGRRHALESIRGALPPVAYAISRFIRETTTSLSARTGAARGSSTTSRRCSSSPRRSRRSCSCSTRNPPCDGRRRTRMSSPAIARSPVPIPPAALRSTTSSAPPWRVAPRFACSIDPASSFARSRMHRQNPASTTSIWHLR